MPLKTWSEVRKTMQGTEFSTMDRCWFNKSINVGMVDWTVRVNELLNNAETHSDCNRMNY